MKPRFIVGEVSKTWTLGGDLPVTRSEFLSGKFEEMLAFNWARGYRLLSFAYSQVKDAPGVLNESLIAVFEAVDNA